MQKISNNILINIKYLYLYGVGAMFIANSALAAETPKRKSGLWEIKMQMNDTRDMGPIQQCIDQSSDSLIQQLETKAQSYCHVMDIKYLEKKVTLHSICKFGRTTIKTDAVFSGLFDTAYKGMIKTSYNPPLNGKNSSTVNIEAKWLSPCLPEQKPGDVILPNRKGININEMIGKQRH
jgi:hypothetical protein